MGMPEWMKRTVFGVIFGGVIVGGTWWNPLLMQGMWWVVGMLIVWEYTRYGDFRAPFRAILMVLTTLAYWGQAVGTFKDWMPWLTGALWIMGIGVAVDWRAVWRGWMLWWWNALFLWGVLGLAFSEGNFHPAVLLGVIFTVWIHDVVAYALGNLIGGRRMASQLSPGKRWSGAVGGWGAGTILGGWLFGQITVVSSPMAWMMAGAATLGAFVGDLIQSAWKRELGIKDSGQIIPGHGGILDRMDALMVAAPAAYLVMKWMTTT